MRGRFVQEVGPDGRLRWRLDPTVRTTEIRCDACGRTACLGEVDWTDVDEPGMGARRRLHDARAILHHKGCHHMDARLLEAARALPSPSPPAPLPLPLPPPLPET